MVRTRFAPSPTGYLHIGGLRAALFEFAYAKSLGGKFILRIEDTDRKRYVEGSVDKLTEVLKVFGITWDEGPQIDGPYAPYIQSLRLASGDYKRYAVKLVEEGRAYYCFCKAKTKEEIKSEHDAKHAQTRDICRDLSPEEAQRRLGSGEIGAIRLRVPDDGEIGYFDFILNKDIVWQLRDVDEAMLLKSDGYPTYHLGVVVDDVEMKISHILRGFEWLPSTPIHLLLFKYFNYDIPKIGHFSLILDPEGGKLSKRKRNVSCEDFLAQGYLPEAILNYVMLMGWAPKDNREFFTLAEYVNTFQQGNLQIANSIFDLKKLDWFNGQYIRQKSDSELIDLFKPYLPKDADNQFLNQITPLIKERIVKLSDINSFAGFFFAAPQVDTQLFGPKSKEHLAVAASTLKQVEVFDKLSLDSALAQCVADNNFKTGDFFMTLRIAITGSKFTPPINESMVVLGKDEVLQRINLVYQKLTA